MEKRGQEGGEVDQAVVSALQGQRGAVAIGVRLGDRMDSRCVVASGEADLVLQAERRRGGTWVFIVDQIYCGQQGQKTENTFSRANYRSRAKKSERRQRKQTKRSCHGLVIGLLITQSGFRIPCCRCYYTEAYSAQKKKRYRMQTELAAELIRTVGVPATTEVFVLGDTAFEVDTIGDACATRMFRWIVPINAERVLAGAKGKRPKVWSLVE